MIIFNVIIHAMGGVPIGLKMFAMPIKGLPGRMVVTKHYYGNIIRKEKQFINLDIKEI